MVTLFNIPKPVPCTNCGHAGFATEAHARTYASGRRTAGAQVVVIECPKGAGAWHVADTKRKPLESYKAMLMSGPPEQSNGNAVEYDVPTPSDTYPCQKVGYATELLARAVLEQAKQDGRSVKDAYVCNRCNCWHLTSHAQQTITDENVITFADQKGTVKVLAGRWPTGEIVSITIKRTPGPYVRFSRAHAAVLGRALAVLLAEEPDDNDTIVPEA